MAGVRQEIARAGQLVEPHRHDRPDAGVRPFDFGDERRGDAGAGLPRGQSPKLPNFKKAAFIIFLYSLLLTASVLFFAVLPIPDQLRMKEYAGNLIGGLAMNVLGPPLVRLFLNVLVVMVGFLILSAR